MMKKGNRKQHAVMAAMLAVFVMLGLASTATAPTSSTSNATASFPTSFIIGEWKRDNFNNTITLTRNTIKSSSQSNPWTLTSVSGNSYRIIYYNTYVTNTLIMSLINNELIISGDSGMGENNWNGTWKRQTQTQPQVQQNQQQVQSQQQQSQPQQSQQPTQQFQQQPQAVQPMQYWTGTGGRGMSITILPPQATGLTENQSYLPALVQGEFVSNFSTYSAISVLDRQRLDNQYLELFSGYYDDNAAELMDIGRLSPTTHILTGNITRTETGYALQMYATRSSDKMTIATYSGTFTFAELDNLSGIRQASFELLQKLGVNLTTRTQEELARPASANHVSAQTALAQGITAQRQGNTETALSYYFQASAFDPSLIEAHNRTQLLAAYVEGGITFSETISASITTANPSNRYAIVLLMPGRVSTSVTSDRSNRAIPNHGADVQWLNADGMRIGGSSGGFTFPYNDEMYLDAGVYYIEVNGRPGIGNTGTYSIKIEYFTEERESNNTRPNAQILVSGLTVRGQLTAQDNSDIFRYDLTIPGRLTVNVTGDSLPNGGASIFWYDENGNIIKEPSYYADSFPYNQYLDLEAGSYYIAVNSYNNRTGTYNLRGDFKPAGNNEIEPNNTQAVAQLLVSEQTVKGFLSYQDDRDIFRYDLTVPGRLTVNITRDTLEYANVRWFYINGTQIRQVESSYLNPYNISTDLEAGTYFIEIIRSDNSYQSNITGTYNLRGDFTPAGNNEREPNNTRAAAQVLTSGQTVRASLSLQDEIDMFRFDLAQPSRLSINVTRDSLPNQGANIHWLDVDGNIIRRSDPSIYYAASFPYNEYMDLEAGIYFIAVIRYSSNTGTYNLRGDVTAR